MADTHGFDIVIQAGAGLLRKTLRGAWKSAACPVDPGDVGRIPEVFEINEADGFAFGPYAVEDGQVQIPQEELDAALAPDINGVDLKLGLHLQLQIKDPPIPSAGLFDMTADVHVRAPVGTQGTDKNVYILLQGLPRDNVSVSLTSGDPIGGRIDALMREYVHQLYEANGTSFPHTQEQLNVAWNFFVGTVTVDTYSEIFDDLADPAHAIVVTRPDADHLHLSVPIYVRIYNIRRAGPLGFLTLLDPMGIETRLEIDAPFDHPPTSNPAGSYGARLSAATVTVGPMLAAGPEHGDEGQNFTDTLAATPLLESVLQTEIQARGLTFAKGIGDRTIAAPTVQQIEQAIGNFIHGDLIARGRISVWTPEDVPAAGFSTQDVTTRVGDEFLAIALNAQAGTDVGAIASFLPADRDFAVGVSAARMNAAITKSRQDAGLTDADLPKRMTADDDTVDVKSLSVFLVDGSIRVEGDVTVIDAILGSIDVDATFQADVGLRWKDNPDGTQRIEDFMLAEPDVDPEDSVALWVITLIIAVITGGLGAGIIAAIVLLLITIIVDEIATNIGSGIIADEVSGAAVGLEGWPATLSRIGHVQTHFADPITIDTTGLVMSGTVEVISSCEATAIAFAQSGGAYAAAAATPLTLVAHVTHSAAMYEWLPGDGSVALNVQDRTHTYAASGIYVAKHALTINQAGGVRSRHFALVDIKNVPPTVDAGPDLTVNEGELVTLVGRFWDVEWPDTHETSWTFGDDQAPQAGVVDETNSPPRAAGKSTVQHAWCQNGNYEVTFRVRDQNGGMAVDTRRITVLNVPPVVDAGKDLYAYRCTVLTLTGRFTDPGWCDTHRGTWDFGDCTPEHPAVIEEEHNPPEGRGVAIASHTYECCGKFQVTCTVIDEDGAAGRDTATVEVVELANPSFESGFRRLAEGRVANAWTPYVTLSDKAKAAAMGIGDEESLALAHAEPKFADGAYQCEECVVYDGQRSQGVRALAGTRAGLFQSLGANPGWDYQVSAWYSLVAPSTGSARLGIDPLGGSDPDAPQVVWTADSASGVWTQLCARAQATGSSVTIFLELEAGLDDAVGFLDCVEFLAVQRYCPETVVQPPGDDRPPNLDGTETCIDFRKEAPRRLDSATLVRDGFVLSSRGHEPLTFVTFGQPAGTTKLMLSPSGLTIQLPFPADRAVATVSWSGGKPPELAAFDEQGTLLQSASSTAPAVPVQTLEVRSSAIYSLRLTGQEAGLLELCIRRAKRTTGRDAADGPQRPKEEPTRSGAKPERPSKEPERPPAGRAVAMRVDAEVRAKLDQGMHALLRNPRIRPGDPVQVLLTIRGAHTAVPQALTQAERAATLEDAFRRDAEPLIRDLEQRRAKKVQALWLIRAVSVTMSLAETLEVARNSVIEQVTLDVPRRVLFGDSQGENDE